MDAAKAKQLKAKWNAEAEAEAQERACRASKATVVFKTVENSPPAAPPPAPDSDEQFVRNDVLVEIIAELSARHQALKDEIADLKRAKSEPAELVASTKELRRALADVRDVLDSARSVPLDLPALPRRDN